MFPSAEHFELSANFRGTKRLLKPAWRLIAYNQQRHPKPFIAARRDGQPVQVRYAASEQAQATNVIADIIHCLQHDASQTIAVLARTRRQLWFLERAHTLLKRAHLTLSTFHEAKGREWDTVLLIGAVRDHPSLPVADPFQPFPRDPEEERRLFYVAMTRARQRLYIHVPLSVHHQAMQPSPFLLEAGLIRP